MSAFEPEFKEGQTVWVADPQYGVKEGRVVHVPEGPEGSYYIEGPSVGGSRVWAWTIGPQYYDRILAERPVPKNPLVRFIERTEAKWFRNAHDVGADDNALLVWNELRKQAGLPVLTKVDLHRRHIESLTREMERALKAGDVDAAKMAARTEQHLAVIVGRLESQQEVAR